MEGLLRANCQVSYKHTRVLRSSTTGQVEVMRPGRRGRLIHLIAHSVTAHLLAGAHRTGPVLNTVSGEQRLSLQEDCRCLNKQSEQYSLIPACLQDTTPSSNVLPVCSPGSCHSGHLKEAGVAPIPGSVYWCAACCLPRTTSSPGM